MSAHTTTMRATQADITYEPDVPASHRHDPSDSSLLYRFEAQLTFNAIGIVPEGLRMANAFEGTITHGIMKGARLWGVDHLLVRRDGVSVIDAPKTLSLGAQHVYEHVQGYCLPPQGLSMPPLEAVLEPDFVWPDIAFPVRAFSTFRTSIPELSYLNRAIARIQGSASFATGRLVIETRLDTPDR